ncbi:MAG TPA: inositol monophosphatase family protein [Armatimonadota bacterium]|jgi:myo-inositol-1(or 4)-monophosphatase
MGETYLEIAVAAVQAAGALQREGWRKPALVRERLRHDIKLQMDVDCEELIRGMITRAFPDHAILGEEGGGKIPADTPTWIVDPLDGTVNYSRQVPHFCSSVAVQIAGKPVAGAVYDPIIDELYTASQGHGAFLNGEQIRVSAVTEIAAANVGMGFAKSVETIAHTFREMQTLARTVHKLRIMGSAALDLAYVACGRYDGFLEFGLRTWDIAAGMLLITEAGGRVFLESVGEYAWDVRADNGHLW